VLAEGGRVDSSRVENITYILRTMQLEDADQFMAVSVPVSHPKETMGNDPGVE